MDSIPFDICYEITQFNDKFPIIFITTNKHIHRICVKLMKYCDLSYEHSDNSYIPEYSLLLNKVKFTTYGSYRIINAFRNCKDIDISNTDILSEDVSGIKKIISLNISNCMKISGDIIERYHKILKHLTLSTEHMSLELFETIFNINRFKTRSNKYMVLDTYTLMCVNMEKYIDWVLHPSIIRLSVLFNYGLIANKMYAVELHLELNNIYINSPICLKYGKQITLVCMSEYNLIAKKLIIPNLFLEYVNDNDSSLYSYIIKKILVMSDKSEQYAQLLISRKKDKKNIKFKEVEYCRRSFRNISFFSNRLYNETGKDNDVKVYLINDIINTTEEIKLTYIQRYSAEINRNFFG